MLNRTTLFFRCIEIFFNIVLGEFSLMVFFFQFIALTWVKEFVQLSGVGMLPHTSSILVPILPCLSYENESQQRILFSFVKINYS